MKKISSIIVVRNGEKYIQKSLDSLLKQEMPKNYFFDIIIVDSMSVDNSLKIASDILKKTNISYKILENKKLNLSSGWNIAILNSDSDLFLRIDVHSVLPSNYIKKCLEVFDNYRDNVAGVGGYLVNKASNKFGEVATKFYESPFGNGGSPFRYKKEGIKKSDTAVYALYRKKVFTELGLLKENLNRNQDIELHKRFIKAGYTFYTNYNLPIFYFVRSDIFSFLKKGFNDGLWIIKSKSFYLRHLIPFLFFFYLIFSLFCSIFSPVKILLIPFISYAILDFYFSFKSNCNFLNKLLLFLVFPFYHLAYGLGSFLGFLKL